MGVMNATYNLTKLAETDSITALFTTTNEATGFVLFGFFVVAIFFIMILTLYKSAGFPNALMAASFVCLIISLLLGTAGLLNFYFSIVFVGILTLTVLLTSIKRE